MNTVLKKITIFAFFMALSLSLSTVYGQYIQEQELKVNVKGINNSTEQLKKLVPVTFDYDIQKFAVLNLPKGNQYGFLMNDVKESIPNIAKEEAKVYTVSKNTTKVAKYDAVDTENLIPLLVAAIKEQQQQIEALQQEVAALKGK